MIITTTPRIKSRCMENCRQGKCYRKVSLLLSDGRKKHQKKTTKKTSEENQKREEKLKRIKSPTIFALYYIIELFYIYIT